MNIFLRNHTLCEREKTLNKIEQKKKLFRVGVFIILIFQLYTLKCEYIRLKIIFFNVEFFV